MNYPLVSVIIPNYNKEKFLSKCIKSVLMQTYQNFEIIVVDNFSDDKSMEILRSFSDTRIRLIEFQNNGIIGASRNIGIEKSKGLYLAFLDSDDYWTQEKLEQSIIHLENGADFVYHDFYSYLDKSFQSTKTLKCRSLSKNIKHDLLINGNPIITSSVVIRKKLFNEINNFSDSNDLVTVEDYDAWIRFSTISNRFFYLKKTLGFYYIGESNSSNSIIKQLNGTKKILSNYSEEFKNLKIKPNYLFFNIGRFHYKLGNYNLSIRNIMSLDFSRLSLKMIIKSLVFLAFSIILLPFSKKT